MCFVSPPGYQPIYNPSIPYVGPIYGGLKTGMSLYIKGTIHQDIKRFEVNLQYGEKECSNKALHFNPRFQHHEVVVFNSFQHGWKNEERVDQMPFHKGESFELIIIVTSEGYQVKVNSCPFYMFKHRMPVERVRALNIAGDISVEIINFIGGGHGRACGNPGQGQMVRIPHVESIQGGLRTGMSVHVQGTIPHRIKRFYISFLCGQMRCSDKALCFNPRFKHCEMVRFNSFQNGCWKREERVQKMPFSKGENFDLVIAITSEGYQVNINDHHFYLFRHRIPVKRVNALEIVGDIAVQTVNIIGGGREVKSGHPGLRELEVHSIPFVGPISGGLRTGMSLLFHGTILPKAKSFYINLQSGGMKCSDKALHFRPWLRHVVIFNSFRNGWRREEKVHEMPFREGEEFELVFIITSEGYQVNVNGQHLHLFKHRMPVERVKALEIVGGVSIQTANIIEGEQGGIPECPDVGEVLHAPYVRPIHGGLRAGMSVYFQGTIPHKINRFYIIFKCGGMNCCDKALYLSPRFTPMEVVLFNSFQRGKWRREEKVLEMPFCKGESFELVIAISSEGYQVNVNGHQFHIFKHRLPVERVTALEIGGDVAVQTVNIIEAGQGDMQGQPGVAELAVKSIPFLGPIYGGLRVGMSLFFRGTIPVHNINRFYINLQCGKMRCSDKAFHFNPRFRPCEVVVFNSFQHGWKMEERVQEMPFRKGEEFELVFIITSEGYQVNVNGQDVYLFKHRIPVERVRALEIGGDVSIQTVNIIEGEHGGIAKCPDLEENVSVPCVRHISGGLRIGMSLYFKATVPHEINRFNINLGEEKEGGDIALHISSRFTPSQVVVFNTFRKCHWGKEERVDELPFHQGDTFELVIVIVSEGYRVNVNGQYFYTFRHRMPLQKVSCLQIEGDISVQSINIVGGGHGDIHEHPGETVNTPYLRPIHGVLRSGMSVYFQGTIPQKINRFHINFKCGGMKCCDKALHLNFQFRPCQVVVFNTFRRGRWRKKETVRDVPFSKGESIEMVIVVNSEGYQMNVNGHVFYMFKHRMPVERVTAVEIRGDVFVQTFDIIEGVQNEGCPGVGEIMVPSIPYLGPIPGGLRPGMSLFFQGTIPDTSNRFHINLQCGEMRCSTKAFHFNPRFRPCEMVVFNSFRNGWRREERVHKMPFRKGGSFELVIVITSVGYQVNINGRPFYLFKHRLPIEQVRALEIAGGISIQTFNIIKGEEEEEVKPERPDLGVISNTPYMRPITGGLRTGMSVYIQGTIPHKINRFYINFNCGEMKCCDKAMHLNPRFKPCEVVVFNTFRHGWKKEERVHKMPFSKGKSFEMVIVITSAGYQVNVNGQVFYMFKHRLPVERVTALEIGGQVFVQNINITGGVQADMRGLGQEELVVNSIPYVGPISGLRTGMSLYFQGTIPHTINRFHINLQCGEMRCSAKAFHFNPRFRPCEMVVFNSFRNGWRREERVREMPFRKGESFELVIAITSEGYQVIVNGRQFYLFRHRIPVERVRVLEIAGDVSIQTVNIIRMNTPYVRPISSGLRPGMSVYLRGTIPHAIKSFNVNLQCGEKKDIALHFNPRFTPSEVVVFNTLRNDSWENEERVNVMPFHKGGSFELVFIVTPEGYQVNVDGCHFYLYKHRIPVEQVTAIQIGNDVSIQDMDIIEGEPGGIQICPGGLEDMSTPYVRPISCGLRTGMSLLFQGTILNTCDRFSINLKCGEKKDIALHFNPRFENLVVVFNTFQNGSWEQEETVNKMPFQKGKSFELFIVIKSHGYQVIANGRKFYLFKHRIPVEQVSALEINGDVSVQNFEIIQGVLGEIAICPGMPGQPDVQAMVVGNIPYVRPISGGLKMGMSVYFQGTIPHKVNRFHINFKCGDVKGCDKAMHLVARFRPCVMVGFNTFQNGCWKKEKRVRDMPFSKGESFEMVIVVATEGYQVNVNGQLFYMFKHHIPVEQVSALEIAGDVSVQTVNITEGEEDIMEPSEEEAVICTIPHVRTIHSGLRMGMSLCVKGIVPHEITRFSINLQCGEKIGCDKAFHFNPRFDTSKVVFNSFRNGSWENEESVDEMPFRKGEEFVLVIVITSEGYQVIVNNCQFYLFKHRIPLDQVSALEMDEDFSMSIIEGEQEGIQEQPDEEEIVTPQYVQTIDGVKTGMSVYFQGSIPDDIKGFSINLLCGEKDGCDNAFHFNPRFESSNLVVFNTFRNGSWEEEERVNEMPFSKGEDFEMVIVITAEGYQVNVNGSPFHFFKHRLPVDQVSAIQINEDVSMQTIEIFEGEQGGVDEDPHEDELAVSVPQYVQPISGGLKKGMSVYFQGTIPDETKQFSINLQCGEKDSDIALHFNPRLESSVVVFNTFQNGEWNEEEKVNEMPFHKGESFELVFVITSEGYQVIINDKKFYLFKHRVLVEHVGAMQINGDVFMQTITMLEGGEGDIQEQPGLDELVVTSPQYVQPIPGLKTGMSMYFQGSIPDEINKFSINLQCGETDGCDIALHFSPQFEPSQMVVFNSFKNGSWEQEEKVDEMPFSKGEKFELIFIITSEGYQVNVNSKPFHMFKLRMPVEQVSAVQIDGDICMETVTVIEVEELPVGDSITLSPGETTVVSLQIASYVQPISGLRPGVTLYFQGSIPDEIDRFSIDLQCGETDGCDKVLHFNPQFEPLEGVVFNSFKDGSWEQEERVTEMPFSKGSDFELAFIITSEGYQVNVNGRPLHMFKHRLQVDQVRAVQITGNISMRTLNVVQDSIRGDMGEEYQTKELQVISGEPIYNPSIPYSDMIPGGMTPKKTVVISGNVPPGASSFACNFLVSSSGDTAFQINPRVSEGVVVRNSCKGGNWGAEERETDVNPFQEGKSFEMLVRSGNQKFTVYVNGNYMCDYVHHVQTTNQIDKLEIVGDVQLSYLLF